ncbi:hypothetical protein [Moraxella oblonga]|nr:hypothetical protein [Moraxella oblonga]
MNDKKAKSQGFGFFIRLPAKLGFPFALSLSKGGGKPLWFDKLTTNGFP